MTNVGDGVSPANEGDDSTIANDDTTEPSRRVRRSKRKARFICEDVMTMPYPPYVQMGYIIPQAPQPIYMTQVPKTEQIIKDYKLNLEAQFALSELEKHTQVAEMPKLLTTDYSVPPKIFDICHRNAD